MGQNPPYRPICEGVNEITVNNVTDEAGWIKIYGKNANALILGDASHEGGDISVYRDTSGNKQLFVNADAANNMIGVSIYGGVGCAYLDTAYIQTTYLDAAYIQTRSINQSYFTINIPIDDSAIHIMYLMVAASTILSIQATGNGAGGIDVATKAIGLYGTTPTTQAAAITDPAESIVGNNAAIDSILAALRAIGLIAT